MGQAATMGFEIYAYVDSHSDIFYGAPQMLKVRGRAHGCSQKERPASWPASRPLLVAPPTMLGSLELFWEPCWLEPSQSCVSDGFDRGVMVGAVLALRS